MMHLARKIEQAGATGYILLWLLGIPIPILILIFLLRGCTKTSQTRFNRYGNVAVAAYVFGYRCFAVAFQIESHWERR